MTFNVSDYNRPVTQAIANMLNQGMTMPSILGGSQGVGWWNRPPDPSTAVDPQTGRPFDLSANPNASWNGNGWVDSQTGNVVAISGDPSTQAQGRGQLFGDINATGPSGPYQSPSAPPTSNDPAALAAWLHGLDQQGVQGMHSENSFHYDPKYGLMNDPGNRIQDSKGLLNQADQHLPQVMAAIAAMLIGPEVGAALGGAGGAAAGAGEAAAGAGEGFLSTGVSNAIGNAATKGVLSAVQGGKPSLLSLLPIAGAVVGPALGEAAGLTAGAGSSLANTGLGAIANGGISPSGILGAANTLAGSPVPSWMANLGGQAITAANQSPTQSPIPTPQPVQNPTFAQLLANSKQNSASPTASIGTDMTKQYKKGGMVKKPMVRAMADGDFIDPADDYTGGYTPPDLTGGNSPEYSPTQSGAIDQSSISSILDAGRIPNLNLSGGSNPLSAIGSALFGQNGGSLANWASLLAPFLGAGLTSHATGQAAQQMTDSINHANDIASAAFGTAQQNLAPWQQGGLKAFNTLSNQAPSTIGSQFSPIQSGGALASQFKPLGSGRGLNMESGGNISGPGGPRADKVPIMASNGEFIINAASTDKFRPLLDWINKQGKHMADGGDIAPPAQDTSMLDRLRNLISRGSNASTPTGMSDAQNRQAFIKWRLDNPDSAIQYPEWLAAQAQQVPKMAMGGDVPYGTADPNAAPPHVAGKGYGIFSGFNQSDLNADSPYFSVGTASGQGTTNIPSNVNDYGGIEVRQASPDPMYSKAANFNSGTAADTGIGGRTANDAGTGFGSINSSAGSGVFGAPNPSGGYSYPNDPNASSLTDYINQLQRTGGNLGQAPFPTATTAPFNPRSSVPSGATAPIAPATPTAPTLAGGDTLPMQPNTSSNSSTIDPVTGQPVALPNASYGVNVGDYLNPGSNYAMQEAMRQIQQSAAGRGGLNSSGTNIDMVNRAMGIGLNNYNNAFNQANQVGNFNYGVDTGDRNFAYNAANNDRNYQTALDQYNQGFGFNAANTQWNQNNQLQNQLANYGLQATGQSNSLQAALAQLLGQNTMTGGQVLAGGTMGQNNALTGGLTSGVGSLTNTNLYNQLMQLMQQQQQNRTATPGMVTAQQQ